MKPRKVTANDFKVMEWVKWFSLKPLFAIFDPLQKVQQSQKSPADTLQFWLLWNEARPIADGISELSYE